jgi:alkylhydroperoxidase family enzyme
MSTTVRRPGSADLHSGARRHSAPLVFGRQLALDANDVSDALYDRLEAHFNDVEIVDLTAFGALMIVDNLFNSALKVEPDESLGPYKVSPEILFG